MRLHLIFAILAAGLLMPCTSSADERSTQDLEKLVQMAIQDATTEYDLQMSISVLNGAQSKRSRHESPKSTPYSREVGRSYSIYRRALNQLTIRYEVERSVALNSIQKALPKQCELKVEKCDPDAQYRTTDGTCNNLANPHWGAVNMPNARLLEPAYEGVNDEPRGGRKGVGLPTARKLSLTVHQGDGESYETLATHMVPQFGQFLDHDFTITPVDNFACCGSVTPAEDCWVIDVSETDPHYQNRTTCLDFVRSTATCLPTSFNRREQFNAITAYIDGSVIYGSDENTMNLLRYHQGGRLVENRDYPGFLPWESELIEGGSPTTVKAGDVRANEMPGLTSMHSLFLREHNRIADQFALLTNWDDERIFQETRRIIAAELQQITYNEYLPAILGQKAMQGYELQLPPIADNFGFTTYNDAVDATIFNSFATAAYRFGHTLVNGLIKLMLRNVEVGSYRVKDNYLMSDQVIATHEGIEGTGYDLILNGLIQQNSQAFDSEIHSDLSNDLFMNLETKIGTDLAARNIQRGRDHGLPGYNQFRKLCGIPELTTWDKRPSDISEQAWVQLRNAYEPTGTSPGEIDLYSGGLSQTPVEGGLSGPTFVCLQATQFKRLMSGDRFFFTHANVPGSFSGQQLAALRSRTLGDIICQNSLIQETQENVFHIPSEANPTISCDHSSRQIDMGLFAV